MIDKLNHLKWMLDNFPDKENVPTVKGKHDRW